MCLRLCLKGYGQEGRPTYSYHNDGSEESEIRPVNHRSYLMVICNVRLNADSVYWTCVNRPGKGRVTSMGDYVRTSFAHDHPPDNQTFIRFTSILRKRARDEIMPMQ